MCFPVWICWEEDRFPPFRRLRSRRKSMTAYSLGIGAAQEESGIRGWFNGGWLV